MSWIFVLSHLRMESFCGDTTILLTMFSSVWIPPSTECTLICLALQSGLGLCHQKSVSQHRSLASWYWSKNRRSSTCSNNLCQLNIILNRDTQKKPISIQTFQLIAQVTNVMLQLLKLGHVDISQPRTTQHSTYCTNLQNLASNSENSMKTYQL